MSGKETKKLAPTDPCLLCSKSGKMRDELGKLRATINDLILENSTLGRKLESYRRITDTPEAYHWLIDQVELFQGRCFETDDMLRAAEQDSAVKDQEIITLSEQLGEMQIANQLLEEKVDQLTPKGNVAQETQTQSKTFTDAQIRIYLKTIRENCRSIASEMGKYVKGQDEALYTIQKKLIAHFGGLRIRKPTVLLLNGPTGCGKTYTAEMLNGVLFRGLPISPELLEISGGDYQEGHLISNLGGTSKGYVGYGDEALFPKHVRNNPVFSLVMVDEVEKAHKKFFNYFLRPFDKGLLIDNQNDVHDMRWYVFMMTGNIGQHEAQVKANPIGLTADPGAVREKDKEDTIKQAIRKTFPPEFVNRVSASIHYDSLSPEATKEILKYQLAEINKRARADHDAIISLTEAAREQMLKLGFSRKKGARELHRVLEDYIEGEADLIDLLALKDTSQVTMHYEGGKFTYKKLM